MGLKTKQVLLAVCDHCEKQLTDYDTDGLIYFDSPEDFASYQRDVANDDDPAEGDFYSWSIDGEVLTCTSCREKAHCREHGHWLGVPEWTGGACMCCGELVGLEPGGGDQR